MAPKKDDKKKDIKGGQTQLITGFTQTITEDELNEAKSLPQIKDFIFTNFYIFKKVRNETRLKDTISKQFQYNNPEEPGYSDALAVRYKQIDRNQLVAQAMSRGLLTEIEVQDLTKIPIEKVRKAFAQATIESVTAYQLQLRQKRRDQMNASSETISAQVASSSSTLNQQPEQKFDQIILLKDFPKSSEDMQALIDLGFDKMNLINLIEENFIRDIDNNDAEEMEEIEYNQKRQHKNESQMRISASDLSDINSKNEEILITLVSERVKISKNVLAINKIIKKLPENNNLRNCFVQKIKFEGPDKPMDLPKSSEDGQELPLVDEALKAQQFQMYDDFAKYLKSEINNKANAFQDFRNLKNDSKINSVQLWPVKINADELARMKELEEKRAFLASREKEEAERKAAIEAAASKNAKVDPKKSIVKQGAIAQTVSTPDPIQQKEQDDIKQQKPRFLSQDDDPSKTFDYLILKKTLNELPSESLTVGSILGAMIYQISQNQDQRHQKGLNEINGRQKQKPPMKRKSSLLLKKEQSIKEFYLNTENEEINKLFENIIEEQTINYGIIETEYQHKFNMKLTQGDFGVKSSPYILVNSDNDKMILKSQDEFQNNQQMYLFPNGQAQDQAEKQILDRSDLPGTKGKFAMPEKALSRVAVRESQMNQVVEFCQLSPQYTKRCLVLKAFQNMMKKLLPERQFYFMDRNFIEEHKDSQVMKQVINQALLYYRPDVQTQYYELDDALLLSLFYKNPPGRLLRRQWTQSQKVLPDFPEWFSFGKDSLQTNKIAQYLEIQASKVGLLKKNTKFMFPSDNSIIRVEKMRVSCKRLGLSQIFKDNFIFGINERKEVFQNKVEGEEGLLNRDAKKVADNRCDFWLLFENGVRLNIQMQDSQSANMDLIPPNDIQAWLKKKIALEEKIRQQEANSDSMSQNNLDDNQPHSSSRLHLDKPDNEVRQSQDESQFSKGSKNPIDVLQKTHQEIDQDEKPSGPVSDRKTDIQIENQNQDEIELETKNGQLFFEDSLDLTSGAKLIFTFNEGLIVTVLPNGDIFQKNLNQPSKQQTKGQNLVQDQFVESQIEEHRIITGEGEVIKQMGDGNITVYYLDGTITQTDKRRGIWQTVNGNGIIRVRRVKGGIVSDEVTKLKIIKKVDPETNAILKIREDGVLLIDYVDESKLTIFPDGTNILKKKRSDGDAGTITLITKDNYAPVRLIYDPVKARARTIIGLGGTDALMGKDNIMVRSNTGKVSEVLLPDKTVVQSYLERQELEGYNKFSTSMVHLVCRSDYSVVKVRQDGEIVLITANERAYLNEQGQQIEDFGNKDYDYFFEMFGIPNERRSGVYTANLDSGKIWTQDEEGNYFIVYANGDSIEKMSVSFDLDQMVEGIEYKEPNSPRIQDGEFIEDQCKFLPPPKSMADPRLFLIKSDGSGIEFFNKAQLQHMFRTYKKEADLSQQNSFKNKQSQNLIKQMNKIVINNEECNSHIFIQKKPKKFDPQAFDVSHEFPKLPQTLELLNQTLSIPTEPIVEHYTIKNIIEFTEMNQQILNQFQQAIQQYDDLKAKQQQRKKDFAFEAPKIITTAAPPADRENKMRSTMQSVFSNQMSPKSSYQTNPQLAGQKSVSPRQLRDSTRQLLEKQIKEQMEASKRAFEQSERDKLSLQDLGTDVHFDGSTGQQLVFNTMELNQMQKLQMRICNQRGIDVVTLAGKELQVLKEYKKKQENVQVINNLKDFFDSKYTQDQQSVVAIQDNHQSGDLNQYLQADIYH